MSFWRWVGLAGLGALLVSGVFSVVLLAKAITGQGSMVVALTTQGVVMLLGLMIIRFIKPRIQESETRRQKKAT